MNSNEFNNILNTSLGGNLVDVELTPADYSFAFKRAKTKYIQHGNNNQNHGFMPLNVVVGTRVYPVDTDLNVITNVIRPSSVFAPDNPFHVAFFREMFSNVTAGGSLLDYELTEQLIERLGKYSSRQVDFHHNKHTNEIQLFQQPEVSATWFIEGYYNLPDDDYRESIWIQDWAISECMIILGRAYSKFSSLPGPSGEVSMNGDQMIQEAQRMQEDLLKQIDDYTDGDPAGGPIIIG